MLNNNVMQTDYKNELNLIKEILYSSDPEGIIFYASPDDEFDNEINKIISFISTNRQSLSPDKLLKELIKIFLNNKSVLEKEVDILKVIAQKIFDRISISE